MNQKLRIAVNPRHSPQSWVGDILNIVQGLTEGIVERQLVGAKLARLFKEIDIPNHPAQTGDKPTSRTGDFNFSGLVYHVAVMPSRDVIQKCTENIRAGSLPILLVPRDQEYRAKALSQDEGVDEQISIFSIENYIAISIIELAIEENTDLFSVFQEVIQIYNRRLAEVETDLSLLIEVR